MIVERINVGHKVALREKLRPMHCLGLRIASLVSLLAIFAIPGFGADGGVGQEMRRDADQVLNPPSMAPEARTPPVIQPPPASIMAPSTSAVAGQKITNVVCRGDVAFAGQLGIDTRLSARLVDQPWDAVTVMRCIAAVNLEVISNGYTFAVLKLPRANAYSNGVVVVDVDAGRIGHRKYTFGEGRSDGRYFSAKQIERRFQNLPEGTIFQYDAFYDGFYELNAHPDITADVDLRLRTQEMEDQLTQRYVDMDFAVQEKLPLHAVLDVDDYGTQISQGASHSMGGWEAGLLLQYLNLCGMDDTVTVNGRTAFDGSQYSFAGSYQVPHNFFGLGGNVTFYGGYSSLNVNDVGPSLGLEGTGYFAGLQYVQRIFDSRREQLAVGLGLVFRHMENSTIVTSETVDSPEVDVMPLSLSLIYTSKRVDTWGGRNYGTLECLYNLGGSSEENIQAQRADAKVSYGVAHLQLARLQTLFGTQDPQDNIQKGTWVGFFRFYGQYATVPLIPSEEMGFGGANSVRGYLEREYLGDNGGIVTVELRSPMLLGLLSSPFYSDAEAQKHSANPWDRIQFVLFLDGAYMETLDTQPSQTANRTLLGVGPGIRMALTQHAQLKLDYGMPLENAGKDSSGVIHVDMQVQF